LYLRGREEGKRGREEDKNSWERRKREGRTGGRRRASTRKGRWLTKIEEQQKKTREGRRQGGREAGRKRTAASMLAGLSSLGSESILMTDATSASTPRIGREGGREGGKQELQIRGREGGMDVPQRRYWRGSRHWGQRAY